MSCSCALYMMNFADSGIKAPLSASYETSKLLQRYDFFPNG